MSDLYDLVVLGTGTAGSKVAERCRAAGWRVAIADDRPFGGTCALRGCEPKKALWTVAEGVDRTRRLRHAGVAEHACMAVDWPAAMAFKRSFTDPVPERRRQSYAKAGIEAFAGSGRFVAPETIAVGDRVLRASHVLIATGATPAELPIEGAEHLITSDDFLDLDRLPGRILLVGGGYISVEFAHIASRAGATVTMLHEDQQPLAQFDQDLVARVVAHARRTGINVELGAKVERIVKRRDGGILVEVEDGRRFEADVAVHGLGRVPNLQALDLAAGEVAVADGRLVLDQHLRSTSNPAVYAAGDAAGRGPALTPIASHDADCVAKNLLDGCRHTPDYEGFGSVVFAMPPLASVGLTEAKAREKGIAVDLHAGDMDGFEQVRREGYGDAGTAYKVLICRETDCILGAHIYAPEAEEVINLFALSVRLKLRATDLGKLISAYPSGASNIASMLR